MTRRRLDAELVRRGLAPSRDAAREAIRSGTVAVEGVPAAKPARMVGADTPLTVAGEVRPYVSRGGEKLRAGLTQMEVDVTDARCLDAGASTGGFTDCLLQAGAARVVAVDVGYGQLDWRLRNDPRVAVMERTNVRSLTADLLPYAPDVVVADLSFISLRAVAATLVGLSAPSARLVVLVKPQFEAGRGDVGRGGVVRDPATWRRVLVDVAETFAALGAPAQAAMASPLVGPAGNVEFLLLARRGATRAPLDIDAVVRDGEGVAHR